jgi:protein involved in polysaccharide export with SLBB domain
MHYLPHIAAEFKRPQTRSWASITLTAAFVLAILAGPITASAQSQTQTLSAPAAFPSPPQFPSAGQSTLGTVSNGSDVTNAGDVFGQSPANPGSVTDNNDSLSGGSRPAPVASLSSDQIIELLQQNPDIATELKTQLAQQMGSQGVQIDPNDISDQMLYDQVATNARLRANITTVLRARGDISEDEIPLGSSGAAEENGVESTSSAPESLFPGGGWARTAAEAGSLAGTASSGAERNFETTQQPSMANRQGVRANPRAQERANSSTDLPVVLHQPTPLNLESMRDLYTQIPSASARLERFGSDVFVNRTVSSTARTASGLGNPLDVPLGPDYVIGVGDQLTVDLWGGTTQTITRVVDRDGRIFLPEAGALDVAGLTLAKAQSVIASALKQQYRDAQVAVTISNVRSIRVYVVGDVQRPGGYDVSSLATPLSAFYAAGGPTAVGSLRILHHYRNNQVVEDVDLYDFLLHGVRNDCARFESGDTLLVPPAGPQVAISGAVKRQAIYELKTGETRLSSVIDDAGGFTAAASISNIRIERIDAEHKRTTVTLPDGGGRGAQADEIAKFEVKDGDRIRVEPILPYSQRAVYLAGHVVRPGRVAYTDGMRLSDVIRSYQDLLPEPAAQGEIVRLVPPDLHAETIDFDVPAVLIGNSNVDLQPFDTVRVFGRYQVDAPMVTIRGEVLRPGEYPMSKGMTAAQLVRLAGGFRRDALLGSADLTSYEVKSGNQIEESLTPVRIGAAVSGADLNADVSLKPGDILAIHQITNWTDIGESVTIRGEVKYPGSYGFQDGERLSSVLRRAGGILPTAYTMGAVLVRQQVRELEQRSRDELIRQIETGSAAARLSPNLSGSSSAGALQLIREQQDQVIADLRSHPPTGRMVIHITPDIDSWANTPADIELRRGDVLTIPKQPGFVLVTGQVYNATALTFAPGKSAAWYLSRAGGTNATANRKEIFIVRANGSVVGRRSEGPFGNDVLATRLYPGDVVVVPQKLIGGSLFLRNLLSAGQLAGSIAVTAGVAAATL